MVKGGRIEEHCDDEEQLCPLCLEELDLTDRLFRPCQCGYQICVWCFHNIKDKLNGLCPACRTPYHEGKFETLDPELQAAAEAERRRKRDKERADRATAKAALSIAASHSESSVPTDRAVLKNVRVMQRNLVYLTGLPPAIAKEEMLRKKEHFGRFGRIVKVAVNRKMGGTSYSAYVTFKRNVDAADCIQHANNQHSLDGKIIRATFGTTKYCSFFLRHVACSNSNCLYLHELARDADCFTKEDLQHEVQMDEFDMDHATFPSEVQSPAPVAVPGRDSAPKPAVVPVTAPIVPPAAAPSKSLFRAGDSLLHPDSSPTPTVLPVAVPAQAPVVDPYAILQTAAIAASYSAAQSASGPRSGPYQPSGVYQSAYADTSLSSRSASSVGPYSSTMHAPPSFPIASSLSPYHNHQPPSGSYSSAPFMHSTYGPPSSASAGPLPSSSTNHFLASSSSTFPASSSQPLFQSRRSFASSDADRSIVLPGISTLGFGKSDSGPFGWEPPRAAPMSSSLRDSPAPISPPDSPRTRSLSEQQSMFRSLLPNIDVSFMSQPALRRSVDYNLFPGPAAPAAPRHTAPTSSPPWATAQECWDPAIVSYSVEKRAPPPGIPSRFKPRFDPTPRFEPSSPLCEDERYLPSVENPGLIRRPSVETAQHRNGAR